MPDYSNSKIYKIVNNVNDKVYIGSTAQTLTRRMYQHRDNAKRGTRSSTLYQAMRHHGIDSFKIVLITDCPCDTEERLIKKEFQIIKKCIRDGIELYNMTTEHGKMCEVAKNKLRSITGTSRVNFKRGCVRLTTGNKAAWQFTWRENGHHLKRTFGIKKYGYEEAKRLAEARRDEVYPIE